MGEMVYEMFRVEEEAALRRLVEATFSTTAIGGLLDFQARHNPDAILADQLLEDERPLSLRSHADLFRLCQSVLKNLRVPPGFKVDFYLNRRNREGACSHAVYNGAHVDGRPHLVILDPSMVDLLEERELQFLIGHKLGHLLLEHSRLDHAIGLTVLGRWTDVPPAAIRLHEHWEKLCAISADRFGLLAAGDVVEARAALLKMSEDGSCALRPGNPARIKALELFAESKLLRQWRSGRRMAVDKTLAKAVEEALVGIHSRPSGSIEIAMMNFIATAGIAILATDEGMSLRGTLALFDVLAEDHFFPMAVVEEFRSRKTNGAEVLEATAKRLVRERPESIRPLFRTLASVLAKSGSIAAEQAVRLIAIGEKALKIPAPEAISLIVDVLGEEFVPELSVGV